LWGARSPARDQRRIEAILSIQWARSSTVGSYGHVYIASGRFRLGAAEARPFQVRSYTSSHTEIASITRTITERRRTESP
jgi:hypothetical protein